MTQTASSLRVPSSLAEYFDSSRSTLNPRNQGSPFYVYGMLPQTITRLTAVTLTPNKALPALVPEPGAADPASAPKVPNPELGVPKLWPLQALLNPEGKNLTDYWEIYYVGRSWSTLFDLGSVLVVFVLGRRLYGRRVGLLAALLLALSVLPIQLSHFFTVDAATAFFALLSIYCAVRVSQDGGPLSFVALGLSIGGAMACRATMGALGLMGVVAVILRATGAATRATAPGDDPRPPAAAPSWGRLTALLLLAGALAFLTFRVLQPDAFVGSRADSQPTGASLLPRLDPLLAGKGFFDLRPEPRFVGNLAEIGRYVSGEADSPPSQQWAGRVPYLFAWQNSVLWGLGPLLGLAGWGCWALAGWQIARRRRWKHTIPWVWIAFYFAWQGGIQGMTMRYYLLLYGLLAIFAAWGLLALVERRAAAPAYPPARARDRWLRRVWRMALGWMPLAAVVLGTLLWAYAFTRIYTVPHSRIMASRWIYDHIPPGAAITFEQWDDALPLNIDGRSSSQYTGIQMTPYAEDDQSKYTGSTDQNGKYTPGLLDQLDQADYVILSSNRVYDSATRMPIRYPALTRYYHGLFSGELGFREVADIHSYPTLFGWEIPTPIYAEEALSVYDHPRVLIFQKTPEYSRARAERIIAEPVAWGEVYKLPTAVASKVPTGLRLTDLQWPTFRAAGTWAESFDWSPLARLAPWLIWLLTLELLGMAAFVLLFRLLPGMPDGGYALSKTLGLLLAAYPAWLLASLGGRPGAPLLPFGAGAWLSAGLLIGLGALLGWSGRERLLRFVQARRRALLTAEGLFLAFFFAFLIIRALNPDLWHPARGGEKPMDLAFLTAVVKSPAFPPYDPWFAGGFINYYYFGFVLIGTLVKLTGIVPTVAYNLAVPTIAALTALGAWGVAYNLLGARRPAPEAAQPEPAPLPRRERPALAAGLLAAVFVVLLGSLANALWLLPGTANPPDPTLPAQCVAISSYAAQQACRGRSEWAFWDATRLVGMALKDSTISEFPFFTFLFGDLHAHMIALPLALAALGLIVALARGRRRGLGRLTLLALVVGALRATNTWDYPTYLGLGLLALGVLGWRQQQRGASWRQVSAWAVWRALLLIGLSSLLWLPFTRSFATDYAGFEIWKGSRTPVSALLTINGLWLFLCGAAVLIYTRARQIGRLRALMIAGAALLLASILALVLAPLVGVALLGGSLPLLLLLVGLAAALLLDMLAGDDWARDDLPDDLSPRRAPAPSGPLQLALPLDDLPEPEADPPGAALPLRPGIASLLLVTWGLAALGLGLLTEVLVAKGDIGRMNTVFKLGMQSWTLFAVVSAVALVRLWEWTGARRALPQALGWGLRGVALALIAAALVYPLTATPARLADRFDTSIGATLDGAAYMRAGSWNENGRQFSFDEDAQALEWMRQQISGTPIVLEAQTEGYRWGGRVSIYTGLPTLLGWPWHETQQRSVAQVGPVLESRRALVQQLYNLPAPDISIQLLRLYGVEYVYVGKLERALYSAEGLAKFDVLVQQGLADLVYSAGQTRIYRLQPGVNPPGVLTTTLPVKPAALPARKDSLLPEPVGDLPAVGAPGWNRLADWQPAAVLLWLLAGYALAALGLPLATTVFGRAPDGGYAWARLIGWLLLGYAVWLPASARLWRNDLDGLLIGALLVLALNTALLARLGRAALDDPAPLSAARYWRWVGAGLRALRARLRAHARQALIVEGLFLAGFAAMLVLRMLNPDLWQPIWGGEKPFEFGMLNAVLRSPFMPPYSPFFSDGTINYYYYGFFLVSLPIKATGIAPAVAFNLIIPTLFGLTLAGAYALVTAMTGRARYGLAGAALVTLVGNLTAVITAPGSWSSGLGPVRSALAGGLGGFGAALGDWFVGPSRVIPYTINEFPYWSFLFADLHPHLIALPITILAAAIAYHVFAERLADLATLGLAALSLGALAVTNSWDFPTYGLLLGGALLGAAWRAQPLAVGGPRWPGLLRALLRAVAVGAVALLLYLPFFGSFAAQVRGIGLVRDGSGAHYYLLIYGLFLAILIPLTLGAAWRMLGRIPGSLPARLRIGLLVVIPLLAVLAALQPALGLKLWLLLLLLVGGMLLLPRQSSSATWFALWMAVAAWAISLGIELIYVRDHLAGGDWYRMNTVFKFGFQVWVLLALAAAASLPRLALTLRRAGALAQTLGWAALAALTALTLVFPLVGTPSRVAYRFPQAPGPTLDGLAFLSSATYEWEGHRIDLRGDGAAISWLNRTIQGSPVVAQSSMEFYRAYGVRVAANTGLPTIVSPLHESEQRSPDAVGDRDRDVIDLYRTTDVNQALRLLSKYRVGYLYVGPIERAAYGEQGTAKFERMVGSYLNLAYQKDGVTIYQVNDGVMGIPGLDPVVARSAPDQPGRQVTPEIQPVAGEPAQPAEPAQPVKPAASEEELKRQVAENPAAAGPAFALAQLYRTQQRYDEAADTLAAAANANPSDVGLHHLWGDILRDAGRDDEAEAAYRQAIASQPTAGNYNKLGVELLHMGRLPQAEEALRQALAADAQAVEPYIHLGEVYEKLGDKAKAARNYAEYLQRAPTGSYRDAAAKGLDRLK